MKVVLSTPLPCLVLCKGHQFSLMLNILTLTYNHKWAKQQLLPSQPIQDPCFVWHSPHWSRTHTAGVGSCCLGLGGGGAGIRGREQHIWCRSQMVEQAVCEAVLDEQELGAACTADPKVVQNVFGTHCKAQLRPRGSTRSWVIGLCSPYPTPLTYPIL